MEQKTEESVDIWEDLQRSEVGRRRSGALGFGARAGSTGSYCGRKHWKLLWVATIPAGLLFLLFVSRDKLVHRLFPPGTAITFLSLRTCSSFQN